jgi:hypothetical protein
MTSTPAARAEDAAPAAAEGAEHEALPSPSNITFTKEPWSSAPPSFIIRMVLSLHAFLLALVDRLVPAEVVILERSTGVAQTALLGAVTRAGIPDLLEERGALDAEAIARAKGLSPDAVHRTLRALATQNIFSMRSDGTFENNRISRALVSGRLSRTREWVLYFSSESNTRAWLDYPRTLQSGKSAFARVHGQSVWAWFDAHPDEREMFAHAMMGLTVMDAPAIAAVYPFREIDTLCDVGGGRGTLLSELLIRHPHMKGVLCDGEGVIASAVPVLEARGVRDRVELVAGSFFERVPAGSSAYLMKNVLHDWDDEACVKILGVVRNAMRPGKRILLCEALVERLCRDAMGTLPDIQMMIICDEGRERGLDELRALLERSGFRYTRVFRAATIAVIEGEAV